MESRRIKAAARLRNLAFHDGLEGLTTAQIRHELRVVIEGLSCCSFDSDMDGDCFRHPKTEATNAS